MLSTEARLISQHLPPLNRHVDISLAKQRAAESEEANRPFAA